MLKDIAMRQQGHYAPNWLIEVMQDLQLPERGRACIHYGLCLLLLQLEEQHPFLGILAVQSRKPEQINDLQVGFLFVEGEVAGQREEV